MASAVVSGGLLRSKSKIVNRKSPGPSQVCVSHFSHLFRGLRLHQQAHYPLPTTHYPLITETMTYYGFTSDETICVVSGEHFDSLRKLYGRQAVLIRRWRILQEIQRLLQEARA